MNHFQVAKNLANLLDNQFEFLGFHFGLDPIIGIVPVFGDIFGLILSLYIVWIGYQSHIPSSQIAVMWRNVILDFVLGSIPFIGDVSDFFFKANSRNLAILEAHYGKRTVVEGEIV